MLMSKNVNNDVSKDSPIEVTVRDPEDWEKKRSKKPLITPIITLENRIFYSNKSYLA